MTAGMQQTGADAHQFVRPPLMVVVAETPADYAIALAIGIADRALHIWRPVLVPPSRGVPAVVCTVSHVHDELRREEVLPRARWRTYQYLWYRWLAPLDVVAPMRWYLAGLAGRAHPRAADVSEQVDEWLQALAGRPADDRAAIVREIADCAPDAPVVTAGRRSPDALALVAHAAIRSRPFVEQDGAETRQDTPRHALDLLAERTSMAAGADRWRHAAQTPRREP